MFNIDCNLCLRADLCVGQLNEDCGDSYSQFMKWWNFLYGWQQTSSPKSLMITGKVLNLAHQHTVTRKKLHLGEIFEQLLRPTLQRERLNRVEY